MPQHPGVFLRHSVCAEKHPLCLLQGRRRGIGSVKVWAFLVSVFQEQEERKQPFPSAFPLNFFQEETTSLVGWGQGHGLGTLFPAPSPTPAFQVTLSVQVLGNPAELTFSKYSPCSPSVSRLTSFHFSSSRTLKYHVSPCLSSLLLIHQYFCNFFIF